MPLQNGSLKHQVTRNDQQTFFFGKKEKRETNAKRGTQYHNTRIKPATQMVLRNGNIETLENMLSQEPKCAWGGGLPI